MNRQITILRCPFCETKIDYVRPAVGIQNNIRRFQISMYQPGSLTICGDTEEDIGQIGDRLDSLNRMCQEKCRVGLSFNELLNQKYALHAF